MSWTIPGPMVLDEDARLVEAWLWSPSGRGRNDTNYIVVDLGWQIGTRVEYFGTVDQRAKTIQAGTRISLLPLERSIPKGAVLQARVSTSGTPDSVLGMMVHLRMRVGRGPLVSSATGVSDVNSREALEGQARVMNGVVMRSRDHVIALQQEP